MGSIFIERESERENVLERERGRECFIYREKKNSFFDKN